VTIDAPKADADGTGFPFAAVSRMLTLLAEGLCGQRMPLLPTGRAGADAFWRVTGAAGGVDAAGAAGGVDAVLLPPHGPPGAPAVEAVARWRLMLLQQLQWQAQGSGPVWCSLPAAVAAGPLGTVFTLLEHWRAEAGLQARWPGAAPALARARAAALAARPEGLMPMVPSPAWFHEALLQLSLGRALGSMATPGQLPDWLAQMHDTLVALGRPGCSAADSLRAARALLAAWRRWLWDAGVAPGLAVDPASPAGDDLGAEPATGYSDAPAEGGAGLAGAPDLARPDPAAAHAAGLTHGAAALATPAGAPGRGTNGTGGTTGTAGATQADDPASRADGPPTVAEGPARPGTGVPPASLHPPLPDLPAGARVHFVDEWDHLRQRHLPAWCRVIETRLHGGDLDLVRQARHRHAGLLRQVWRQFAALRPQALQLQRGCSDGEEIELDTLIDAVLDHRRGAPASDRLHRRRQRGRREVATAFLVDMSASTDFAVPAPSGGSDGPDGAAAPTEGPAPALRPAPAEPDDDEVYLYGPMPRLPQPEVMTPKRRVIDVQRDALVLMCDALQALGDRHAVYGFTGQGRHRVEFHVAKEFDEALDARRAGALAAMQPRGATRMGAAIRHALHKLKRQPEPQKLLIVVSDGYPQDQDYGPDRLDEAWGLHDTAQALAEAQRAGVGTFCVTVDPAGHDYLRRMCPDGRYRVIDEVAQLPAALGQVYRALRR